MRQEYPTVTPGLWGRGTLDTWGCGECNDIESLTHIPHVLVAARAGIVGKWGKHSSVFVFSHPAAVGRKISAPHNDSKLQRRDFFCVADVYLTIWWLHHSISQQSPGNLRDAGCTDASNISHADATHLCDILLPHESNESRAAGQRHYEGIILFLDLQLFKIDTFYPNVNKKLRNIMRSLLFVTKRILWKKVSQRRRENSFYFLNLYNCKSCKF